MNPFLKKYGINLTIGRQQFQTMFRAYNVTWTTGKIYILHSIVIKSETYRFLFHVDKRLTLNITFLIINFFKASGQCEHNRLEVIKSGKTFSAGNLNAEYTYIL